MTAQDLRVIADIGRKKGDSELVSAALLRMVQRGVAAEADQRQVRRTAAGPPVAVAPTIPTGADDATPRPAATGATGADIRLVLRRPDPNAPARASIGEPGTALDYWRPAWTGLPPALVDQLAASVLTRLAVLHQVTTVHATDPASAALAAAIADGAATAVTADTRYGEQP